MINPAIVEAYLAKQVRNLNKIKEVSPEKALENLHGTFGLPADFFNPPLFDHQVKTLLLALNLKRLYILNGLGSGKSRVMIEFLRVLNHIRGEQKCLILIPANVNIQAWLDEIKKFGNGMEHSGFSSDSKGLVQALADPEGIIITTYAGFLYSQSRARGKRPMGNVDVLIMDESTAVKNHKTKIYKLCADVAARTPHVFAMTGTPFGRDPQDIWSQYYLIDRGETLGRNISFYRQAFFKQKINYFGGYEYTLRDDRKEDLQSKLYNHAILYKTEECIDLPPFTHIPVKFTLPPEVEQFYSLVIKELARAKDATEINNVFVRMRYLTSGYLAVKLPDGTDNVVRFPTNPKLDGLLDVVNSTNEKVVVFCEYKHTVRMILEEMKKAKIQVASIYGSRQSNLDGFTNGKIRILVATSASASMGVNLQCATYMVFFESPVSPLIRQQAEKRIHRTGQTRPVFFYDFVVTGTVDEKILGHIAEGKNLLTELLKRC